MRLSSHGATGLSVWGAPTIGTTTVVIVALSVLTIGAFLVRLDRLQGPDGQLREDESRLVLAAQGVLSTGLPTMPSGKVYLRGVVNTYLTAASIGALGMNDFAARLPNTIVGALLVPMLFVFGRALGGTTAGLCSAAFAAVQPELIYWSTSAWMTSLFIVVFVTATYLLYLGYERDHPRMQVAGATVAVLGVLAHELGALLALAVMLTVAIRAAARDFRWFAGRASVVALSVLVLSLLVFLALGLQLRAATVAGAGGEFRHYFGPSLSSDRWLVDYHRWQSGYVPLLAGAVLGIPLLLRSRASHGLFLYVTMAVASVTIWVIIGKESERYGLVLLPMLALLAIWAFAEAVRLLGGWWRLSSRASQGLLAVVCLLVFGVSIQKDVRAATRRFIPPAKTWLTEFRALGPAPGDLVISENPEIPAVYLGRVDYWERDDSYERYGFISENQIRHLYTGALRVAGEEDFFPLLQTDQPKTLWYIGHGALSRRDRVLRSAQLQQTAGEEIILKIPLGPERQPRGR